MEYTQFKASQKQYRKIVEKHYGVKIARWFDVHHKDMNHENNDIDNLIVLTRAGHMRWHALYDPNHSCRNPEYIKIATKASAKLPRTKKQIKASAANRALAWATPRSEKQLANLVAANKMVLKSEAHKSAARRNLKIATAKAAIVNKGNIWVNNGEVEKTIDPVAFEKGGYAGFIKGRLKKAYQRGA